jgi:hypothetical protein
LHFDAPFEGIRMTRHGSTRTWLAIMTTALASACSTTPQNERDTPAAAAGMGTTTTTTSFTVVPDASGWLDATTNDLGLQGSWYPYGDRYGAAKCTNVGMHPLDSCSLVTSPKPPPDTGFPNDGGKMCTSGKTAVILPCATGVTTSGCPTSDYSNMWGAGIGFDFDANKGMPEGDGAKHTWDPRAHGVTGVSFELDQVPAPGFRVEFPMLLTDDEAAAVKLPSGSTTDDHPDGAPYWGASSSFGNSPVMTSPSVNVVRWDSVRKPGTAPTYVFDKSRMLGIQFHVPAVKTAPPGAYTFCISKLTLLRD